MPFPATFSETVQTHLPFWTFESVCLVDELHHTITAVWWRIAMKEVKVWRSVRTFKEPN